MAIALWTALCLTGYAAADTGACGQSVGKDFPAASLAEVGMSAGPLLALNEKLEAGTHDIRSLLIVRDCKLVFERYMDGIGREHNHTVYSVTKSVTSTLVGSLLMQGKLKSTGPTGPLLDAFASGDAAAALARIAHGIA